LQKNRPVTRPCLNLGQEPPKRWKLGSGPSFSKKNPRGPAPTGVLGPPAPGVKKDWPLGFQGPRGVFFRGGPGGKLG